MCDKLDELEKEVALLRRLLELKEELTKYEKNRPTYVPYPAYPLYPPLIITYPTPTPTPNRITC